MKKDIFVINPKSNIAVSTLWRKKSKYYKKFQKKQRKQLE